MEQKKPNVIYILGDDHRGSILGNMGHPVVETPHLDKLANEGILFTNAFCTSPACTPSRCCHYLGQWERSHGVNFNSNSALSREAWDESFPMKLKEQGYYLGWVGKNHVPAGEGGYSSGFFEEEFDYWYGNHGHSMFYVKEHSPIYSNAREDTQVEVFEEGVMNFLDPQKEFLDKCESPLPERPADKPFCLCLTFNLPHGAGTGNMQMRPGDDELYKSKYRDRIHDLELPATYLPVNINQAMPPRLPRDLYSGEYIPQYDYVKSPVFLRERMVRVYQTVTGVDRMIGHMREKLEELGLADNTIIIFSTDHGIHWGEHGLGGKCFLYEEDLHIPMILFDPRLPHSEKGQSIDKMVAAPDLAPTVMELAGFPVPRTMQGKSLVPLIEDDMAPWREGLFTEQLMDIQNYPKSECYRTNEWKYIRYFRRTEDPDQEGRRYRGTLDSYDEFLEDSLTGKRVPVYEELYNLKDDPGEVTNLADNAESASILSEMRRRLVKEGQALLPEKRNQTLST